MTSPIRIANTVLANGRTVISGDTVSLRSLEDRIESGEDQYLARENLSFLTSWLGKGPFTISWIGRWPCGKVMLYLKDAKTGEPGAYAEDFV